MAAMSLIAFVLVICGLSGGYKPSKNDIPSQSAIRIQQTNFQQYSESDFKEVEYGAAPYSYYTYFNLKAMSFSIKDPSGNIESFPPTIYADVKGDQTFKKCEDAGKVAIGLYAMSLILSLPITGLMAKAWFDKSYPHGVWMIVNLVFMLIAILFLTTGGGYFYNRCSQHLVKIIKDGYAQMGLRDGTTKQTIIEYYGTSFNCPLTAAGIYFFLAILVLFNGQTGETVLSVRKSHSKSRSSGLSPPALAPGVPVARPVPKPTNEL
jgi:hypothetical protein